MEWFWMILFAALCGGIGALMAVCARVAARTDGARS